MLPCPAVGATPNPLLRAPTGQEPAGAASHGHRLPRHHRPVRRHRLRRAAVPPAAARRRSDGDAHLRRPGRRLRRPRPEQRLVGRCSASAAAAGRAAAPRPGASRRAARGRPADHRHRRRPRRPAADLAARRRRLRRLRLPHVQPDAATGSKDERDPRCTGATPAQPFAIDSRRAATPSPAPAARREGDAARWRRRRGARPALHPRDRLGDGGVPDAGRARHRLPAARATIRRRARGKDFAAARRRAGRRGAARSRKPSCRSARRSRRSARGRRRSGAIVPPPSPLPGSHVVVARGGPEALDGKAGVPQSTTSYVIGAIVLLALAVGLFYVRPLLILPTV